LQNINVVSLLKSETTLKNNHIQEPNSCRGKLYTSNF